MPIKDPVVNRLYWKRYRARHRKALLESNRVYRSKPEHRKIARQVSKKWRRELSSAVKRHLGGKCFCCGESEYELLSVDHLKNDGGGMYRRKNHYYYREITKAFGSGKKKEIASVKRRYDLACYNCNWSKYLRGGTCVHRGGGLRDDVCKQAVYFRKVDLEVKGFLGGKCTCCGEKESDFLSVDHIRNDGAGARRNKNGTRNKYVYGAEIRNAFKSEDSDRIGRITGKYGLLCRNCNSSKHYGKGTCVHQRRTHPRGK